MNFLKSYVFPGLFICGQAEACFLKTAVCIFFFEYFNESSIKTVFTGWALHFLPCGLHNFHFPKHTLCYPVGVVSLIAETSNTGLPSLLGVWSYCLTGTVRAPVLEMSDEIIVNDGKVYYLLDPPPRVACEREHIFHERRGEFVAALPEGELFLHVLSTMVSSHRIIIQSELLTSALGWLCKSLPILLVSEGISFHP